MGMRRAPRRYWTRLGQAVILRLNKAAEVLSEGGTSVNPSWSEAPSRATAKREVVGHLREPDAPHLARSIRTPLALTGPQVHPPSFAEAHFVRLGSWFPPSHTGMPREALTPSPRIGLLPGLAHGGNGGLARPNSGINSAQNAFITEVFTAPTILIRATSTRPTRSTGDCPLSMVRRSLWLTSTARQWSPTLSLELSAASFFHTRAMRQSHTIFGEPNPTRVSINLFNPLWI